MQLRLEDVLSHPSYQREAPQRGTSARPQGPQSVRRAPADAILRLQRTAGNAAVGRMLQRCPDCQGTCKCSKKVPMRIDPAPSRQTRSGARAAAQRAGDLTWSPSRDCPGYGPGEVERSRTGPGILTNDVRQAANVVLISDFGIDRSTVKPEIKAHPSVRSLVTEFESDPASYTISILGLDDCVGSVASREKLRKDRAESVRRILGPRSQSRVAVADGAPLDEYHSDNRSAGGRAKNRGALVLFETKYSMSPTAISVKRPKPPRRRTSDCSEAEAEALSSAHPIAVAMVEKAFASVTGGATAQVNAIMRKYFNSDSRDTRAEVYLGLRRILEGLRAGFVYECEENDSWFCDDGSVAYAIPLGGRVHVCKRGIVPNANELASTIIHECSHLFDFTSDEEYCNGGCPSSLSPEDAIDNADSYAEFAEEVFTST